MKMIPFFMDGITIRPHTASTREQLSAPITLTEFAQGQPIALYNTDDGLLARRKDGQFIHGPEV